MKFAHPDCRPRCRAPVAAAGQIGKIFRAVPPGDAAELPRRAVGGAWGGGAQCVRAALTIKGASRRKRRAASGPPLSVNLCGPGGQTPTPAVGRRFDEGA